MIVRAIAMLLFMMASCSSICFGAEQKIDILYSADVGSYADAVKGFKEVLASKAIVAKINELSLSKISPEAAIQQIAVNVPNLVLAVGPQAAEQVRKLNQNIPIVCCCVFDDLKTADPNIVRASLDIPVELRLSALKKMTPSIKSIGMIYTDKSQSIFNEFSQVSSKLGYELFAEKIDSEDMLVSAFKKNSTQSNYCFFIIPDGVYSNQSIKFVLLEGLKNKFPVIGLSPFFTKAGAFLSFDCDYFDHGKQAGELGSSVLGGSKPSDLKSVRPRKIKYTLNLVVAEKIGINIGQNVINEASEVFK